MTNDKHLTLLFCFSSQTLASHSFIESSWWEKSVTVGSIHSFTSWKKTASHHVIQLDSSPRKIKNTIQEKKRDQLIVILHFSEECNYVSSDRKKGGRKRRRSRSNTHTVYSCSQKPEIRAGMTKKIIKHTEIFTAGWTNIKTSVCNKTCFAWEQVTWRSKEEKPGKNRFQIQNHGD